MSEQSEMHLFAPGHAGCPGCGPSTTLIQIADTIGKDIVVVNATGCMEITSSQYPHTAWRVPYIHSLFENAPSVASGVSAALKAKGNHHTKVVVIAGDGATYDIGFGALSGMLERGDDVLYCCLHPSEEIILGNGKIEKVGSFVEKHIENASLNAEKIKMSNQIGLISTIATGNVVSFNGKEFSSNNILRVQKLKAPETMVKLVTRSGGTLKLTPEHNVMVDSPIGVIWKRADELIKGDRLFSARKITAIDTKMPKVNEIIEWFFDGKIKEKPTGFTLQGAKPFSFIGEIDEEIAYLLGLIASEGSVQNKYTVTFTNTDKVLLDEFESIFSKRFIGRKVSKVVQGGVPRFTLSHPLLYAMCKYFGVKNDPAKLLECDDKIISNFIAGLFDGDGCAAIMNHKHGTKETRILITTVNEIFSKRLRIMFARLGIASSKLSSGRHDVILYSRKDILKALDSIPTRCQIKKSKFDKLKAQCKINEKHSRTKYFDLAPQATIQLISNSLEISGASGDSIDDNLSEIIAGRRGLSKTKLNSLLPKLSKICSKEDLEKLVNLCSEEFFIDPVKEVTAFRSDCDFVYDITVENEHNFVPANALFTISNCYDNELYANTGVQKSSATPFGAATTTTTVGKVHKGKETERKPIVEIAAAHNIPYAASASISYYADLQRKLKKAAAMTGPRFITISAPCCLGAGFDGGITMRVAKMQVMSRLWFLFEYENGKFTLNFDAANPKPVKEYLGMQKRFKHLTEDQIQHIQNMADAQYNKFKTLAQASAAQSVVAK